jgi:hypothetical protein
MLVKILETPDDAGEWIGQSLYSNTHAFILPIFKDATLHPVINTVSAMFILAGLDAVLLPFDHMDALSLPQGVMRGLQGFKGRYYTPFKKDLMHLGFPDVGQGIFDLASMEYLLGGKVTKPEDSYPPLMQQMMQKFREVPWSMDTVPLLTLGQFALAYMRTIGNVVSGQVNTFPALDDLNRKIIPTLWEMERAGIEVHEHRFVEKFGTIQDRHILNGKVHTQYNPYTTTGRVTSKFNRVNFVALNKSDETRKAFISRFREDGRLILIDFESFHLRLMAEAMEFDLPKEPVHEYLTKQYFGSDTFTPEQYADSKQLTFQLLYGEDRADVEIPFIQAVYQFTDILWETFKREGFITSISGRQITKAHIENPSPAKLFNYFLQLREMEVGMESIRQAIDVLNHGRSRVVLYTYDSVLIDYSLKDGSVSLELAARLMEQDGKFPVRIYLGETYDDMVNITSKVKKW